MQRQKVAAAVPSLFPLAGLGGELMLSALAAVAPHTEPSSAPHFLLESALSGCVLGVCLLGHALPDNKDILYSAIS